MSKINISPEQRDKLAALNSDFAGGASNSDGTVSVEFTDQMHARIMAFGNGDAASGLNKLLSMAAAKDFFGKR